MTAARPRRRVAVVLMNLGGPRDQASVRPFLFNLFNDPAILGLPGPVRTPLAWLIASRREKTAKANYARMGGGSPLLRETEAQAQALEALLIEQLSEMETRVFIAMRYWRPFTEETARDVAAFAPDDVVLLPLYPQFSTTTTASSLKAWRIAYEGLGDVHAICCWPDAGGLIEAHADLIRTGIEAAGGRPVRVLFSAHGVPENRISAGDPYQSQVEATVAAIVGRLGLVDWRICYQSRVGPLRWLGPSTAQAIVQAAADDVGAVVVPIAFVSEHVETLIELDIEYGHLASSERCRPYIRVPALGVAPAFIDTLASLVRSALARTGTTPGALSAGRPCRGFRACPAGCDRRAA